ncbi:MAG: hypothetical protein KF865_12040, partial [Bdellovibrionaceae bacterium]|nr:hypothetical protein [Pseudobdellovibrionaceae bacterium]
MKTARLVLENKLGQQVRTFDVGTDEFNVIYRLDNRRIEGHANLAALDKDEVEYQVIKKVSVASLQKGPATLVGIGRLKLAENSTAPMSPTHELPPEEDKERMTVLLKKTAIGHGVAVVLLVALSFGLSFFNKPEEPQLVTIVVPPKEETKPVVEKPQHVKVSEKKIVPRKTNIKKIANKTVIKPQRVKPVQAVAKRAPTPVVRKQPIVVRNDRPQNLQNVGALAALGGVKNGTRGYEGLDVNSVKNIR